MSTYHVTKKQRNRTAVPEGAVKRQGKATRGEGSFDKVAYEWDNALLLAARRLWTSRG